MNVARIITPSLAPPVGPYVHAVRHHDTLYLSGLTAFGTPAAAGPIEDQAHAIFDQIEILARDVGGTSPQWLKVTLFVTELTRLDALRQALASRYGEATPASTLVRVAELFAPELKIEIEAVLALPAQVP